MAGVRLGSVPAVQAIFGPYCLCAGRKADTDDVGLRVLGCRVDMLGTDTETANRT